MATRKKTPKKKPVKKKTAKAKVTKPAPKVWSKARVSALYRMSSNTPRISKLPNGNGSTHSGSPHEWEWEGEPTMAPVCLGCNATGDYVERLESGEEDERMTDQYGLRLDLDLDDGFGSDYLDDRYF